MGTKCSEWLAHLPDGNAETPVVGCSELNDGLTKRYVYLEPVDVMLFGKRFLQM